MAYQVELDISHEATHDDVVRFAIEHGCTTQLITANGPAGGNPLYLFKSESFDMLQELYEQVMGHGHGFDEEELKTMFVEV